MGALCGFLFNDRENGNVFIGVNEKHSDNRNRFTVVHELGHFMLHRNEEAHIDLKATSGMILKRDKESAEGTSEIEKEANLFAAEILMPVSLLAKDLSDNAGLFDESALEKVAKKYKVSTHALTFRLANLGYISI